MRVAPLIALLTIVALQSPKPVETAIERLATCQDSWRDWKENPAESKRVGELFTGNFTQNTTNDGSFLPNTKVVVVGLPVKRVYPESVGMGVGFSVILDGTFEGTRANAEKALGKTLGKCETGDGMRTCELEIAKERTITLLAGEHDERHETLLGCYYLYEK